MLYTWFAGLYNLHNLHMTCRQKISCRCQFFIIVCQIQKMHRCVGWFGPNWETKSMFCTEQLTVLKSTPIHHFINYFLFAILIWPMWPSDSGVVLVLHISVIRKQIHNRWWYWFITFNILCLNYWNKKHLYIDWFWPPPFRKDWVVIK